MKPPYYHREINFSTNCEFLDIEVLVVIERLGNF